MVDESGTIGPLKWIVADGINILLFIFSSAYHGIQALARIFAQQTNLETSFFKVTSTAQEVRMGIFPLAFLLCLDYYYAVNGSVYVHSSLGDWTTSLQRMLSTPNNFVTFSP